MIATRGFGQYAASVVWRRVLIMLVIMLMVPMVMMATDWAHDRMVIRHAECVVIDPNQVGPVTSSDCETPRDPFHQPFR